MPTDFGTIKLRNPAGYRTEISVSRHDTGQVDLHFSRTHEGEVLVILPPGIAQKLGSMLTAAAALSSTQERKP